MYNNLLVSIIMSEYNTQPSLLYNSIDSIIKQTYSNFELIIIDDCGFNDVSSIVNSFSDNRIKVFKNEHNMGLVYSLNRAISLCNGEIIARMDTDDFSYPNRIETELNCLMNSNYDLIGCRADFYNGENIYYTSNYSGEIQRLDLINGTTIIHPTIMFKKQVLLNIGGYLNYNRCEDYATWIELFANGNKMYVINDILLRYRFTAEDYSLKFSKSKSDFHKLIKEQYVKLNPTLFQLIKVIVKSFLRKIVPSFILRKYYIKKYY